MPSTVSSWAITWLAASLSLAASSCSLPLNISSNRSRSWQFHPNPDPESFFTLSLQSKWVWFDPSPPFRPSFHFFVSGHCWPPIFSSFNFFISSPKSVTCWTSQSSQIFSDLNRSHSSSQTWTSSRHITCWKMFFQSLAAPLFVPFHKVLRVSTSLEGLAFENVHWRKVSDADSGRIVSHPLGLSETMEEFTRENLVSMLCTTRGIPWQIAITIRERRLTEADDDEILPIILIRCSCLIRSYKTWLLKEHLSSSLDNTTDNIEEDDMGIIYDNGIDDGDYDDSEDDDDDGDNWWCWWQWKVPRGLQSK